MTTDVDEVVADVEVEVVVDVVARIIIEPVVKLQKPTKKYVVVDDTETTPITCIIKFPPVFKVFAKRKLLTPTDELIDADIFTIDAAVLL